MSVPKIIMQTWHDWSETGKGIPEKWLASPQSIKEKLPDYEYVLLTNENSRQFVNDNFPDCLETYDNFPYPIQRVDMLRPMWLYMYGGVYMDLDNEVLKDFSEFFQSGDLFFISTANTNMFVRNDFMASRPKHPFWLAYLERMKQSPPWYAVTKHLEIMLTTGPFALASTINNTKTGVTFLPAKFIVPCDICDEQCSSVDTGYIKSLGGKSWHSWDSIILNSIVCRWKYIVLFVVLCVLIWLVWRYTHPPPRMCKC